MRHFLAPGPCDKVLESNRHMCSSATMTAMIWFFPMPPVLLPLLLLT
jgi:hypothetical protein